VSFPLFSKIEVNGAGACDLYKMLSGAIADDEGKADIAWNFTKFMVDEEGNAVARYSPMVTPAEIAAELAGQPG
jgi:glutathione peroxidase